MHIDALAFDECDDEAEQVREPQPSPNISLTQEQYQCLLALFQQTQAVPAHNVVSTPTTHTTNQISTQPQISPMNSGNISLCNSLSKAADWILDSGAIDHICYSLALFTAYRHIPPVQIKLPNGNQVLPTIAGTISFSPLPYSCPCSLLTYVYFQFNFSH